MSISPIPIIGVVLMLSTPRARINGPIFLVGWVCGILMTGAVVIFVLGDRISGTSDDPNTTSSWISIGLGAVLLVVAYRQFAKRPKRGESPKLPSWMDAVDHFDPFKAFALGIALTVLNPKNLILILGASAAIAEAASSDADELRALLIFTLVALIGPAIPVAIYFGKPEKADKILSHLKNWLAAKNAAVMTIICILIAAKLIGDGLSTL